MSPGRAHRLAAVDASCGPGRSASDHRPLAAASRCRPRRWRSSRHRRSIVLYALVPGRPPRTAASWSPRCSSAGSSCSPGSTSAVDHPTDVARRPRRSASAIPLVAFRMLVPERHLPGHLPARARRAHLDVGGAPRRGHPSGRCATSSASTWSTIKPVRAGRVRRARRRCGSRVDGDAGHVPVRQALRRSPTCGPTAGTSSAARCSTAGWRTSRPSTPSAAWSSTRTTCCGCCATPGCPTASPYGFVEITPEREYLLVTEFFDGAQEIGDAEVDDARHRRRAAARPPAVGRRPRPPRHQAGQPAGPRRPGAAHRRRLRRGAAVAVAAGGRPGQHDARPRAAHRRADRLRAGAAAVLRRTRSPRRSPPPAGSPCPSQLAPDDPPAGPGPARRVPQPAAERRRRSASSAGRSAGSGCCWRRRAGRAGRHARSGALLGARCEARPRWPSPRWSRWPPAARRTRWLVEQCGRAAALRPGQPGRSAGRGGHAWRSPCRARSGCRASGGAGRLDASSSPTAGRADPHRLQLRPGRRRTR